MKLKFFAGLVILFIALALQFWFSSVGISLNLSFAALICFAFIFGFWELLTLILIAVFIINWQPAVSLEILIFALFPVAAHFSPGLFRWRWQPWTEPPIAIFFGFLILYFAAAATKVLSYWQPFLLDVAAGLMFAALIFFPLYRWEKE